MRTEAVCKRQVNSGMDWVIRTGRQCVAAEQSRGLSNRSLEEIKRWIHHFSLFAKRRGFHTPLDINTQSIKDFVLEANPLDSFSQGKTIIWCMRKFFAFLTLRQIIPSNPAELIPHPKARPREKLPEYLKPGELASLLESVMEHRSLQDMTIISLLVTAGPRPQEIVTLRRKDIFPGEQFIHLKVKGGWYKRTPISENMAMLFQDYLASAPSDSSALFFNQRGKPIDKRWIERMVKDACRQAGIKRHVTPRILRHTFATYAADRHGVTITRALLGHANQSHSTEVYMHLVPTKFRTLMNCHPYQTTIRRRKPW
jgi:integrase/recombinase XerD